VERAVLRAAVDELTESGYDGFTMDRDPELMAGLRDELGRGEPGTMLTILARAVARGEARPESLTPRVATVAVVLLRNEYLMSGRTPIPDKAIAEIVDLVFLPLVRPGGPAGQPVERPRT